MSTWNMEHFAALLLPWYRDNGRDLPWRHTRDPWLIWLSEVILQQTQIAQGISYYRNLSSMYPTKEDLARAPEDELMRAWQGLGYYSRARNLQSAARSIFGKPFPSTYEGILSLKGVGPYTAAAIASMAFSLPRAVVDGNVLRVLSRYFLIEEPVDTAKGKALIQRLSDEMVGKEDPAAYNQAVMDLGAMVCRPQNPSCQTCPLQGCCAAFMAGRAKDLPVKGKSVKVRDRYMRYLLLRDEAGRLLIRKRSSNGIWRALYEWILFESDEEVPLSRILEDGRLKGVDLECLNVSETPVLHRLTHLRLHILVDSARIRYDQAMKFLDEGYEWATLEQCQEKAFPRPLLVYLKES